MCSLSGVKIIVSKVVFMGLALDETSSNSSVSSLVTPSSRFKELAFNNRIPRSSAQVRVRGSMTHANPYPATVALGNGAAEDRKGRTRTRGAGNVRTPSSEGSVHTLPSSPRLRGGYLGRWEGTRRVRVGDCVTDCAHVAWFQSNV